MKILLKMTALQFKMLLRDRGLLVGSLGLAVVSMLIFGLVFGNNNAAPITLGVVDLDKSPVSAQVIAAMSSNNALKVTVGDQDALVKELKDGQRAAVVVLEPGFGAGLPKAQAQVQFFTDQSDLIGSARARGTITAIFDSVSKQSAGFKDLIQVQEQNVTARQQRQIDFLTPGMLGVTIMFANMWVGLALITWRERGTLKRLSATPLKAWQLIGSQILAQFALSFAQAAIILGLAVTAFGVQVQLDWLPMLALFVIAGTFSIISLGYAIGNFVQKREAAQSVITLVSLPMMFLSGSYFSVDNVPGFMKPVIDILPLTHLNRAFRGIMLTDAAWSTLLPSLGLLLVFGTALLVLSVRTFRWSR